MLNNQTSRRVIYGFCLITLVLIGAGLRVAGLGYGDLASFQHDEQIHLRSALEFSRGNINPRQIWAQERFLYSFYPWLSMYLAAAIFIIFAYLRFLFFSAFSFLAHLTAWAPGGFTLIHSGLDHREALFLGRLTVALFGAATVPVLYAASRRLFNRRVALVAAAFLSFNGYHIANCHWLKNDVIALFFLTTAFYFMVRVMIDGDTRAYVFAAIFSALAVNAKQYNLPAPAMILAAHFARHQPRSVVATLETLKDRKFLIFLFVLALCLALSYPLLWLDFKYVVENLRQLVLRTQAHAMFGRRVAEAGELSFLVIRRNNLLNFFSFSAGMRSGMGIYVLILGSAGILSSLWRRGKSHFLALAFPLLYMAMAILAATPGLRYQDTIPVYPFFALFSALLIDNVFHGLIRRRLLTSLGVFLTVAIIIRPYLKSGIGLAFGYRYISAVEAASDWAERNFTPGSLVAAERRSLRLAPDRFQLHTVRGLFRRGIGFYQSHGFDYLVTSSRYESRATTPTGLYGPEHPYGRFYHEMEQYFSLVKEFDPGEIPYLGGTVKIYHFPATTYLGVPRSLNNGILRSFHGSYSQQSPAVIYLDDKGRAEGDTGFLVPPRQTVRRLLISPVELPFLSLQLLNGSECAGVKVRVSGCARQRLVMAPDETRQMLFSPRPGFPFLRKSYLVEVKAGDGPVLARLQTDAYRVGDGFFQTGNWPAAAEYLGKVVVDTPQDWWPVLLLTRAYRKMGEDHLVADRSVDLDRLLLKLRQGMEKPPAEHLWEDLLGYPLAWLEERAGLHWDREDLLEDEYEDSPRDLLVSPEFFLAPGVYTFRVVFSEVDEPPAGKWARVAVRRNGISIIDKSVGFKDVTDKVFTVELKSGSLGEQWSWEVKETPESRGRTARIVVQPSFTHWLSSQIASDRDALTPLAGGEF